MSRRSSIFTLVLLSGLIVIGAGIFWFKHTTKSDQPAITVQQATHIVSSEFPNSRILVIQLDRKESRLVYEIDLVTAEAYKKEICINAETGQVEKVMTVTSENHPIV